MAKHLKTFAMLLLVGVTMAAFSACSKDSNDTATDSGTTSNAPVSVAGTEWTWGLENSTTGIIDITVGFNGPMLASLTYTDMSTGIMQVDVIMGSYTYSGGIGTMTLNDENTGGTVSVPFSVDGTKMTITFRGSSYTLTKK